MTFKQEYIDFIQFSVRPEATAPASITDVDWKSFLDYCNRQGMIGLVYEGLQKVDIRIPQKVLFEWIGFVENIKHQNRIVDKRIRQTITFFEEMECRCVIMKGQANGLMYPKPELRSSGDIDIWVTQKSRKTQKEAERVFEIIKMVLKECSDAHYSIHHVKLPVFKDVSVEVHYRPIYMANWFADKKLQRYISNEEERQFANRVQFESSTIGGMTNDFNVVYQMLHMYHHFFETRNNWKQFIDYYYLLRKGHTDFAGIAGKYSEFGVLKYASGVMWIMTEILGLDKTFLPVEPNEKEGRLILKESFYFGTWSKNKLRSVIEQFAANFRIVGHYPKEVLISPLFLLWHQWWKVKMKMKLINQ